VPPADEKPATCNLPFSYSSALPMVPGRDIKPLTVIWENAQRLKAQPRKSFQPLRPYRLELRPHKLPTKPGTE